MALVTFGVDSHCGSGLVSDWACAIMSTSFMRYGGHAHRAASSQSFLKQYSRYIEVINASYE